MKKKWAHILNIVLSATVVIAYFLLFNAFARSREFRKVNVATDLMFNDNNYNLYFDLFAAFPITLIFLGFGIYGLVSRQKLGKYISYYLLAASFILLALKISETVDSLRYAGLLIQQGALGGDYIYAFYGMVMGLTVFQIFYAAVNVFYAYKEDKPVYQAVNPFN